MLGAGLTISLWLEELATRPQKGVQKVDRNLRRKVRPPTVGGQRLRRKFLTVFGTPFWGHLVAKLGARGRGNGGLAARDMATKKSCIMYHGMYHVCCCTRARARCGRERT